MLDPYTLAECKHTFSNAISTYIGQPCPTAGCRNQRITANSIQRDPAMARKIREIVDREEYE